MTVNRRAGHLMSHINDNDEESENKFKNLQSPDNVFS